MAMVQQRDKVIFEFFKGKGKHKFHWRARSCNGRILCVSEGMLHKSAPKRTVENLIEAIRYNSYRVERKYEEE